ncbi:MAG: ABC transporter ATP-binding protein [Gammaproteobacteria bacterium]
MKTALSIQNLTKIYNKNFHALKEIDLEVKEGDFFALLGANGAGKSTMIGIITSLINKTAGKVSIFGVDIDSNFPTAKTFIGLVPQEFNFNVFEPVQEILINQAGYFGIDRTTAKEKSEFYLKKLNLWDKRDSQARELSGGMKRRLMIARALVHQPRLLILDEPTAGVDIEIRRTMWSFLREINRNGTTIILTTHYLEEAENLCKNIAIIDQGEIIENRSMKSLLNTLQTETFVLDLAQEIDHRPDITPQCLRLIDPITLEADISKDCSINFIFDALSKQGVQVLSMRNKSNRLEQLFVNLIQKNSAGNP